MNGNAGFRPEKSHHVVLAEKKPIGKLIDGDVLGDVIIQIAKDLLDPWIPGGQGLGGNGGGSQSSAQIDTQLQKIRPAKKRLAEGLRKAMQ